MKTPEEVAEQVYAPVHEEWAWALGRKRLIPLIAAAIEADRAQRAEILATDDAVAQVIEEQGFDWDKYQPNRDQIEAMLARMGFLVADAMRTEPDENDFVVDMLSGYATPLASARIVRNFSRELIAEDPEAIVFYAEAHGQEVR